MDVAFPRAGVDTCLSLMGTTRVWQRVTREDTNVWANHLRLRGSNDIIDGDYQKSGEELSALILCRCPQCEITIKERRSDKEEKCFCVFVKKTVLHLCLKFTEFVD